MIRPAGGWAPLAAAAILAAACAVKKPPAPTPEPLPPALEGSSKYSFIFDPANPALNLPEDVKFTRPVPRGSLALPVYPADALTAGDGPHREIVRIVIDDHGSVTKVDDSPLDGDGKPDYTITTSTEIVSVYYDVRFTFEIVDGKGVVRKE